VRVIFIGNFSVPYCTEVHHAWTFEEKLGWEVIRLQEDKTTKEEVLRACEHADLLSFTHTHSWNENLLNMEDVVAIRKMGVKSYSYHLDYYWGVGDGREGKLDHPSFHLDYFFSTDGGHDEKWREKGINHVWLLPGVVEYGAYLGQHQGGFDIPVLFAGSEHYHPEYQFRPQLVGGLRNIYGRNFQVVSGVREAELNNLYATTRVCVGDHIFAGCPRYCSDRLFETIGRGGFIIYPETKDVTDQIPGLITYRPQDIGDLVEKINYYIDDAHQMERIRRRNESFEYVKHFGTYTTRLKKILEIMGF